jgi:hypothetical protein
VNRKVHLLFFLTVAAVAMLGQKGFDVGFELLQLSPTRNFSQQATPNQSPEKPGPRRKVM